jgi:hypothetical protein
MRVAGIRHRWVMLQRSWPHWRSPTVAAVRGVPWWGVISSAAAPVLLVAAWTVAAALQPRSYDAVGGTVSALAAEGAAARWVMTLAFAVAGACEVLTGLALRPAASPGRLILMAGGAAGVLVAANPQHAGGSLAHAVWAVLGFTALATWPGGAWRRGPSVPWALRPAVSASAAAILLGLLAWFGLELVAGAGHVGLAERVMGLAQATWPLAVVLSCRLSQHHARTPPAGPASTGTRRARAAAPRPFAPGRPGTAITCGMPEAGLTCELQQCAEGQSGDMMTSRVSASAHRRPHPPTPDHLRRDPPVNPPHRVRRSAGAPGTRGPRTSRSGQPLP